MGCNGDWRATALSTSNQSCPLVAAAAPSRPNADGYSNSGEQPNRVAVRPIGPVFPAMLRTRVRVGMNASAAEAVSGLLKEGGARARAGRGRQSDARHVVGPGGQGHTRPGQLARAGGGTCLQNPKRGPQAAKQLKAACAQPAK